MKKRSVSADLWVGRFCLWRGKTILNLCAIFQHQKKATQEGWPKGKSGVLKERVQQMGRLSAGLAGQ
jgi:hypothetical protein